MHSRRNTSNSILIKDKDPLFELIESMSANEKRYFNVQVKNNRNNDGTIPDYFIFFQILNKMKVYDEEKAIKKLLQKLGKKGFTNFTVKKNELYDVLMRHLKNYHFTKMKKSAAYIKILIQDANFLFKRGLYRQANRYLKDARKMAEKCGDTLSLVEINRFEREYLRTNRVVKMEEKIEQLHQEAHGLIEDLKLEEGLIKDYDILSIYLIEKSKLTNKESVEMLKLKFEHLTKIKEEKNFPIVAKRFLRGSLFSYYHLLGMQQEQYEFGQTHFEWWRENDLWRKQMPHYYISTLSNNLTILNRRKEYHKFPEILEILENTETNNQHESAVRFHRLMMYRQLYYMNTGLIDEACNLSKRIEKGLKSYNLNEGVQISLSYNSVIALFVNQDFKECLKWIQFFNPFKKIKRGKLQVQFLQILKIIALYELGNLEELDKTYRSTENYFLKYLEILPTEFEVVVLGFIKKYGEALPNEQRKVLKEMKTYIFNIQSSQETFRRIGAEELLLWIDCKMDDIPMKKLLIEQNRKRASEPSKDR